VPDRDDKTLADDQMGLAVSDPLAAELGGPQHDEEDIVVDIQFGALMRLIGVLDQQLVKPKLSLDRAKQRRVWLVQTQPNDPTVAASKGADFLDRDIAYPPAVTVKSTGNNPRPRDIASDGEV
jgi:hypothetical protein